MVRELRRQWPGATVLLHAVLPNYTGSRVAAVNSLLRGCTVGWDRVQLIDCGGIFLRQSGPGGRSAGARPMPGAAPMMAPQRRKSRPGSRATQPQLGGWAEDDGIDLGLVPDHLHPNAEGYARWATCLQGKVVAALGHRPIGAAPGPPP